MNNASKSELDEDEEQVEEQDEKEDTEEKQDENPINQLICVDKCEPNNKF